MSSSTDIPYDLAIPYSVSPFETVCAGINSTGFGEVITTVSILDCSTGDATGVVTGLATGVVTGLVVFTTFAGCDVVTATSEFS